MRIVTISHAEAADAAVFANIAKYLLGSESVDTIHVQATPTKQIAHEDRPDVGAPTIEFSSRGIGAPTASVPQPPVADAAIVFAGNPVPPVPGVAPSTAAVAAPEIAAVTSITVPTVPLPPAASPASAVVVPAVPAAPPSPAAGGTKIDAKGLPWDPRIHSKTQTTNKDGTWRQKRETDPAYVALVEAELRTVMGIAAPAAPVVAVPQVPVQPAPFQQPAAVPVPPSATAAPTTPARTFGALMEWLEPHMTAGRITQDHIKGAMLSQGVVGGLSAMIHRSEAVPAIWAELEKLVA